jgi:pimeloyl-ACP methyl ester carboxylesterase
MRSALVLALVVLTASQAVKADPISDDKIGVVLMHGKGGGTKWVYNLGNDLESAGALVETPEMPWSKDRIYDKGYEESMSEIDTYVARLKADGAKRIFIAGHSLGGNAALGYAARRKGLSGVILLAYGHTPGIKGFDMRMRTTTKEAQDMIAAGNGEERTHFGDYNGQNDITVYASANNLFSWFDSEGPANAEANAPKVNPNTPVLCIEGSSDPYKRCSTFMYLLPKNPRNDKVLAEADHLGTPGHPTRSS